MTLTGSRKYGILKVVVQANLLISISIRQMGRFLSMKIISQERYIPIPTMPQADSLPRYQRRSREIIREMSQEAPRQQARA